MYTQNKIQKSEIFSSHKSFLDKNSYIVEAQVPYTPLCKFYTIFHKCKNGKSWVFYVVIFFHSAIFFFRKIVFSALKCENYSKKVQHSYKYFLIDLFIVFFWFEKRN